MLKLLEPGVRAPDFELYAAPDQRLALSDLQGRPVILAFYPADWSPVCADQLALYDEALGELTRAGAQLLGISVDSVWCHAAFARQCRLRFPLLADFQPKGAVARSYGAYREQDGVCERALFLLDARRNVFWSHCASIAVNPGVDGILDALERLAKESQRSDRP